jgi:5-methylcytosine-specific restriction enzyme subunit McrC
MESPDLRNGEKEAPGLLFDMNKLFEAHVLQLEKERAPREDKVKGQGPQRNLALVASSKCFTLKPEVTISRLTGQNGADQVHRIVDAKWKRIDPKSGTLGVDQADIYQLLAYAVSYGCRELELVYPEPDRTIYNRVPIIFSIPSTNLTGPVRIQVRTVHLLRESSFSDRE